MELQFRVARVVFDKCGQFGQHGVVYGIKLYTDGDALYQFVLYVRQKFNLVDFYLQFLLLPLFGLDFCMNEEETSLAHISSPVNPVLSE